MKLLVKDSNYVKWTNQHKDNSLSKKWTESIGLLYKEDMNVAENPDLIP